MKRNKLFYWKMFDERFFALCFICKLQNFEKCSYLKTKTYKNNTNVGIFEINLNLNFDSS